MTIMEEHLHNHFFPVVDLGGGMYRCADEMPAETIYTYFLIGGSVTPILVSKNQVDDDFAREILVAAGFQAVNQLELTELAVNDYGLTHLLRAPHNHHSELKGRLDEVRSQTILCIPIHREEFSGNESAEEFQSLCRSVVATSDWQRVAAPKISLRFANTRTGAGTRGEGYVFVKLDQLLREVEALAGDTDGFTEVMNYRGDVVELLSKSPERFVWIADRQGSSASEIARSDVAARMIEFLGPG